uniref:Heparan sulfate glucosamine 3-O-sulfotransferase 5 n=1 Tax=Hirondellea gigas TaxID=1518452 RepID=A0A2P2ICN7_9CRUS
MLFWGVGVSRPSNGSTKSSSSHLKRLLFLVLCLAITFCLLVFFTDPLHSSLSAVTVVRPNYPHFASFQLSSSHNYNGGSNNISRDDGSGMSNSISNLLPFDDFRQQDDDRPPRLRVQGTQRRLPRALIIGVRKCGTRALIEMLNLHPDIRKSDSEVHFFENDDRYMNGLEWYRKKMPYSFDNQITVEKTPSYFVSREAPGRIRAMSASVKLLLIVRDPATRVLSDYAQILESKRYKGSSFKPFHKLVMLPNGEINDRYNAVQISQYVVHILRWLRVFPRNQLHIVDGDKLIHNPYPEMRKIEKFLNLPPKINAGNFYFNRTKGFYCMRNETHQRCLADSKGRRHPYVDPGIIEALRRYFAPFNEQFYQIVGQNFSWPTE